MARREGGVAKREGKGVMVRQRCSHTEHYFLHMRAASRGMLSSHLKMTGYKLCYTQELVKVKCTRSQTPAQGNAITE